MWLVLPVLPAQGQPAPSPSGLPERAGHWMRPVSASLGVCEGGAVAWSRRFGEAYADQLDLLDNTGRLQKHWKFTQPIGDSARTHDCTTVWVLSRDHHHIFTLDSATDHEPVALIDAPVQDEIQQLAPADDGASAWVIFAATQARHRTGGPHP